MPKAKINDISISYKVHGQGEPLVLIMGLGGAKWSWIFQTLAFKKFYQVITFDNRGVGRTDKPSEPFTVKTMADDTIGLMDHLGADRAHILGVSLGGMIAQEIAINYPERVNKLILGCTTSGLDDEINREDYDSKLPETFGLKDDFSIKDIQNLDLRNVDFSKVMSHLTRLAFNKRHYRILLAQLSKLYVKINGYNGLIGQLEAARKHSTLDRLHMIRAPTMVITGTEDRLVPPHSSETLAEKISNAKLVKVEGGSHSFPAEMRKQFNKEVLNFLRE